MAVASIAKLKRAIIELEESVAPGSKMAASEVTRQALRSEIEACIQHLDELRQRL